MTVPTAQSKSGPWAADGQNNIWPFDFRVTGETQLQLVVTRDDGSDFSPAAEDFSVVLNLDDTGQAEGGQVIYPTGNNRVPAGAIVTVLRNPPFIQGTDLRSQGRYSPDSVEAALDLLEFQIQYLRERLLRTVALSPSVTDAVTTLPYAAGEALRWHDTELRLITYPPGTGSGGGPTPAPSTSTFLYRDDIGFAGDGLVDDGPAIQRAIDRWEGSGKVLVIEPPQGGALYLTSRLRVRSGITLLGVGPPVRLGNNGGIRIDGKIAEAPETNKPRLEVAITAGQDHAIVDMGPDGGQPVSARFPVGAYLIIRGKTDGTGASLEYGEHKVTAVDDGLRRITVEPAFEFDYQVHYVNPAYELWSGGVPDRTYLSAQVRAHLSADAARGAYVLAVAPSQIGQLAIGDLVVLQTDHRTTSNNPDEVEQLLVVDIHGDGANTVTVDRPIERTYLVANGARLTKLVPVTGAAVSGFSFVRIEAPDLSPAPRRHTIEIAYSYRCIVTGCSEPNTDAFGHRGQFIRRHWSRECDVVDCYGAWPKHLGSGDGYIYADYYSTLCRWVRCTGIGGRHNFLQQGATLCGDVDSIDLDARVSGHDYHGCGEVGFYARDYVVAFGAKAYGATRYAFTFGNTSHHGGSHRGVIGQGLVIGKGAGTGVLKANPPCSDIEVDGLVARDVESLLYHADLSSAGTLVADGVCIRNFRLDRCAGKVLDVHGGRNGSAVRTLKNLVLADGRITRASRHLFVQQVDGFEIDNVDIALPVLDPSNPYGAVLLDVIGVDIADLKLKGLARGLSITSVVGLIADSRFRDLTDAVVLLNGGGNTLAWRFNDCSGFSPSVSGGLTGIAAYPLPVDQTGDFLTTG